MSIVLEIEIMDKTDAAIEAYIESLRGTDLQYTPDKSIKAKSIVKGVKTDIPIYQLFSDEENIEYPYIGVLSNFAEERIRNTGSFDVAWVVSLQSNVADTTKAVHKAREKILAGILYQANAAAEINALATGPVNYTVIDWNRPTMTRDIDEGALITNFAERVFAMPKNRE